MHRNLLPAHPSRAVSLIMFLLLLFGFGEPARAQRVTDPLPIVGRVTDEKGDVLPGVNVSVKGSTRGTTTNTEGRYQLTVSGSNAVLVFSFIGYDGQELTVGNRTTVDVVLKSGSQSLGEVVVIGYGEQSRKLLATAVEKVDSKKIGVQPVGTPGEALAGLAAGVQIQSERGSTPGAAPTIRVRGAGSLGTTNQPLFVVDGYPLQDNAQFNLINPSDIESMEILKDAASAAIYGSRAANGVVIVTTKRGKAGRTSFNVSAYTGFQRINKTINVLERNDYLEHTRYVNRVTNNLVPAAFVTSVDSLPNTNWQDAIFQQAPISNYEISANGGSENVRFSVSGGYFRQEGIVKASSFERYNLRFNLDANLSQKLKLGLSLAPSYSNQRLQQAAGQFNSSNGTETNGTRVLPSAINSALLMPPSLPVYLPNGDYAQGFNGNLLPNGTPFYQANLYNPLAVLELNKNYMSGYRLFSNGFLEYEPIQGLRIRSALGATLGLFQQSAYIPATVANEQAPRANGTNPVLAQIFAREAQTTTIDWLWENTATYSRSFGNHNLSLLGLYSLQRLRSTGTATLGRAGSYTTPLLDNPLASPDRVGELTYDQNAFLSYGGRLSYDYQSKYIVSAAVRQDASSRFGPNNRFASFPSLSAAWRVSEEPFWAPIKNTISELKLRASYGQTGNANIGSFNWTNSVVGRNYSFNQARSFGFAQNGFANFDLTWEKNEQTDFGLEVGLFNDRFSLSLDYYNRITNGMLFQKDLPGVVGYANTYRTNLGSLRNRGLELTARTNLNVAGIRWSIDGNIAGNRAKVLDLGGPSSLPAVAAIFGWNNAYQVRVGDPLGNMYGFQVEGVFRNADDLARYPQFSTGDRVGNWIIKDQNGDKKIDESDRTYLGKGVPDFIWGLTNTLQYRNFDLTAILQGVQGIQIINGNLRQLFGSLRFNTVPEFFRTMFDPADPTRDYRYPQAGAGGIVPGNNLTDRVVFNGSFVRVRNLTLGYTLPAPLLRKVKLQTARLYVTGQNLFTFTSYPWYNPETNTVPDSPVTLGVDQGTYPLARTFTFGINIGF